MSPYFWFAMTCIAAVVGAAAVVLYLTGVPVL